MLPLGRRRRNHGLCSLLRVSLTAVQSRLFVSWETEALNHPLFTWGVRHSRYLKLWFRLGVGIGLLLEVIIVFMMLLWVFSLLKVFHNGQTGRGSAQPSEKALALVIPGINMPWSDFPYMILATTFSIGIHELGHAIAAASEEVPIEHIAVFLACLIPGALIALNEEGLQLLSPVQSLCIYCAGVWHNVMCCAGCYLLLMLLPVIISPLYVQKKYPVVANIDTKAPLVGHLSVGDSIVSVAGLQLGKPDDWFEVLHDLSVQEKAYLNQSSNALVRSHENYPIKTVLRLGGSPKFSHHILSRGFCACSEDFAKHKSRPLNVMCSDDTLLFYQRPCTGEFSSAINSSQSMHCLKAADAVKCPACKLQLKAEAIPPLCSCSGNTSCMFPILNEGEVFVDIKVHQSSSKWCSMKLTDPSCEHTVVFVGNLKDLFDSLVLTKYWPRQAVLGLISVSSYVAFPKLLETLLMYTFSLSAAMALLNSAPVYYLDGELIFQTWLGCCKPWVHSKKLKRVTRVVLTLGTTLTAFFLISAFIEALF